MAEKTVLTPEDKALRATLKKILASENPVEGLQKFRSQLIAARGMVKVFNETIETVREYRPTVVEGIEKIILRDTTKSSETKTKTEAEKLAKLLG